MRRLLILLFCLSFSLSANAQPQPLSQSQIGLLNDAQDYLAKVKTVKANFIQINPQSSLVSSGEIYISKPGLLKMSYRSPFQIDYYINDDNLVQYDHELDEVTRGNAPDNPLKVLLYDDITLAKNDIMSVANINDEGNSFTILLVNKTQNLRDVTGLALKFRKLPIEIMGIERMDNEGNKTETNFTSLRINEKIPDSEFTFKKPLPQYPDSRK